MEYNASTPEAYLVQMPEDRRAIFSELRAVILKNLPEGFNETIQYGMISYVVPHSVYPKGYHVDPKLELPFISIASQKNHIALYHMGVYTDPDLLNWFTTTYPKYARTRLDMGKSCVRFKKMDDIPLELIGDLVARMTVKEWIRRYEEQIPSKS